MPASTPSSSLLFPAFLPGQLKLLSTFSSFIHLNTFPPFEILGRKGRDGPAVFTSSSLLWVLVWFLIQFLKKKFQIHSLCLSVEIPSPVPTKECRRVKLEQKFKIATCFLTLCCAFLFLGRGGDRNLLPSLRHRT